MYTYTYTDVNHSYTNWRLVTQPGTSFGTGNNNVQPEIFLQKIPKNNRHANAHTI